MNHEIIWNWNPLTSIGPVVFGESIDFLLGKYDLEKLDEEDLTGWDTYLFKNNSTRIYVEDAHIISVACYDNFFYEGKNLIGCTLQEVRKIFSQDEEEVGEITGDKIPIDYDGLGMTLWFRHDLVADVTCHGVITED
jgi:hypothetical protein